MFKTKAFHMQYIQHTHDLTIVLSFSCSEVIIGADLLLKHGEAFISHAQIKSLRRKPLC